MYKKSIEYYTPIRGRDMHGVNYLRTQYNQGQNGTRRQNLHENYHSQENYYSKPTTPVSYQNIPLKTQWKTGNKEIMQNPDIWGPAFWFSIHNGALHYPKNANHIHQKKMKYFIIGLPIMLPCAECKSHANDYIEQYKHKLDNIVKTRKSLFKFFVDFHNEVNKRNHKKTFTLEEAYKLYSNGQAPYLSYH